MILGASLETLKRDQAKFVPFYMGFRSETFKEVCQILARAKNLGVALFACRVYMCEKKVIYTPFNEIFVGIQNPVHYIIHLILTY